MDEWFGNGFGATPQGNQRIHSQGDNQKGNKMRVSAIIKKAGKYWRAESDVAQVHTQGKSEKDATKMLQEAFELTMEDCGLTGTILVVKAGADWFVECSKPASLAAFVIRQQRAFCSVTLEQAAKRLGQTSKNAIARYEQGKSEPTISKLEEILIAINPALRIQIA